MDKTFTQQCRKWIFSIQPPKIQWQSFRQMNRLIWARIKCGRGPRTADRRNCGLSPADWPKIFDSSPQFLHRVAVRSPRIIRAYVDTASTCLCVGIEFTLVKTDQPKFELDHRSALKSSFRRRQCGTKLCKEWYHKKCLPKEQHYAFQEFLKTPWIPQILLNMSMESADTSPQLILSGPHFQSLHVRNGPHFIPKSTKNLSKNFGPVRR
ncbi:hypothetical protein OUZ56_009103 [Daphnia magna]|uniref:Uncharacterized protein n=1 Tax=Daphnia magna TaxID=35525 RepID=A0ABR0AF04_9CRUS|nr:hypothetical protein OUZ56_009103 [Daphnia magna]